MRTSFIDSILTGREFRDSPPVLVDVGASGGWHAKWRSIAKHSICVAFDPDVRKMGHASQEKSPFKKCIVFNRVVTHQPTSESDFYLTASPYCSSVLEPDQDGLRHWAFEELFRVDRKVKLPAMDLAEALKEANLTGIDWLKTDSQGMDLRLFQSLPAEMRRRVLAAEFEPGILDGYKGEDKLYEVLRHMQEEGFFMSALNVKGTQRLSPTDFTSIKAWRRKPWRHALKGSPGWAEVSYLNTLRKGAFEKRDFLLVYVFACLEEQFGFASEIASLGHGQFSDPRFLELKFRALGEIRVRPWRWPGILSKRIQNKLWSCMKLCKIS